MYLWENFLLKRLMVTFMYGFTVWNNIKINLNIPILVLKNWQRNLSLGEEPNTMSCVIFKTSLKMEPIFFILSMSTPKLFLKLTGLISHGRQNGKEGMMLTLKKCLNTKKIMWESLNNKFTEITLRISNIKSF